MHSLGFRMLLEKCSCASIFLSKHAVDIFNGFFGRFWKNLSAPPVHFGIFELFGPQGVALGKTPMLTQVLGKQTEIALVRPMPYSYAPPRQL